MIKKLTKLDLRDEQWREYDFGGRAYTILEPQFVWMYPGCTTHRVLDATGEVHCVPAVGVRGCVVRWRPKNPENPVAW